MPAVPHVVYELADSAAARAEARAFLLAQGDRTGGPGGVACVAPEAQLEVIDNFAQRPVWFIARHEGEIVSCFVLDIHPRSNTPVHARYLAYCDAEGYASDANWAEHHIAMYSLIAWPGCCGNTLEFLCPPPVHIHLAESVTDPDKWWRQEMPSFVTADGEVPFVHVRMSQDGPTMIERCRAIRDA